jgi:DNA invertase Pin-like site-specific DNA recombinase
MQEVKKLIEDGFAAKRVANILKLDQAEVRKIIKENSWSFVKEEFSQDKIERIIELYKRGVSAKQLGFKFGIDKRRVQKWASNNDILRNKNDSHRFTEFNQHIFDVIDTPQKAYWLGFFYADAYNCDITNTFSLTLAGIDYDHLVKLTKFIELPVEKIIVYNPPEVLGENDAEYATCSVKMYSKHVCSKMTELGCMRAKSFLIKYPEWLPKELNVHFIRGIIDGDGSIYMKNKNNEWKINLVSTKECLSKIEEIIMLETECSLKTNYLSKTNNNTYIFNTGGNQKVKKICDWLYKESAPETRLDRKYQKYLDLCNQQANRSIGRENYNIPDEEKLIILDEIKSGIDFNKIAEDHKINRISVSRINKKSLANNFA